MATFDQEWVLETLKRMGVGRCPACEPEMKFESRDPDLQEGFWIEVIHQEDCMAMAHHDQREKAGLN